MFRRTLRKKTYAFVGGPHDGLSKKAWGGRELKYFDIKGEKLRQTGVYRKKRWSKTYIWEEWIYI